MALNHVLRERIKEHAEAGADHRLAFSADVPCEARARREILLVRVVKAAEAGLAHLRQGEGLAGGIEIGDVAEKIVLLLDHSGVVPAQAVIQSQLGRETVAVLGIEAEVLLRSMPGCVPEVLETFSQIGIDIPREEISDAGAGRIAVKAQVSAGVSVQKLLYGRAVEIETKLHAVLVKLPGEVVENLVVAIDTMTGVAGVGAELGYAAGAGAGHVAHQD